MSAANNRREVLKNFEMIEPEMVPILQAKTEAERLAMSWGMWRSARNMLLNMLNAEHPEWTEAEVQTEIARRMGGMEFDHLYFDVGDNQWRMRI